MLCVEPDGHVTVESADVSGRCTDADIPAPGASSFIPTDSHCGDCQDQVIDSDTARRNSENEDSADPAVHLSEICLPIHHFEMPLSDGAPPAALSQPVHLLNGSFLL